MLFFRLALAAALSLALVTPGTAGAHGGGLDGNGGHHCREAGYASGSCAPLDSYHCHQAGCADKDGDASAPPPPPPTTAAPTTTTQAPTTTTVAATTTTPAPATTAAATPTTPPTQAATPSTRFSDSTTSTLALDRTEPVSDTDESSSNPVPGALLLGAMGYGGYRVFRRVQSGRPGGS